MPILIKEDYQFKIPKMYKVKQIFNKEKIDDVTGTLKKELLKKEILTLIRPGMKVAIAVGSRGINHIADIVKETVVFLKECGAEPFIVSAMGSHGGGTTEGQKAILASYGITEDAMGVKVITDVTSIEIGSLADGQKVYFDKTAYDADLVIPINRIKLHTDFCGKVQSGLCKMLVIGLGNQKGCSAMHEVPPEEFADKIVEAASLIIKNANIGFGIAIMENAYDETVHIETVMADKMVVREEQLASKCKSLMPYICIKKADVIIVDQVGKDISGAGFDPNILGRSSMLKEKRIPVPEFQNMILCDITDNSHGNAIGIGYFDIVLKQVVRKLDYEAMYTNAVAVRSLEDVKIPLITSNLEDAVRIALKTCRGIDINKAKIIRIKNTQFLDEIEVSENLLDEVRDSSNMELIGIGRMIEE